MEIKRFQQELKNVLKGYKVMDSCTVKKFRKLGFSVLRSKNHYILQYRIHQKKYEFVFSKTASDFRAGYKQAGVIYRTLKPELIQD